MKNFTLGALVAIFVTIVSTALGIQLGIPDFAADKPHGPAVFNFIEWARERSIAVRAQEVKVPEPLVSEERVRRGAGNYEAMCSSCHLAPGVENSELRQGLYPQPLDLTKADNERGAPGQARQFWIIKHGIKGSGMPAWGQAGVDDAAVWELVAFLQKLPSMSPEDYKKAVKASDGHSHGGSGETPHRAEGKHPHGAHSHQHRH